MQDVQTFTQTIEGFDVSGVKIKKFYLNFHNSEETIVDAVGDLSEYTVRIENSAIHIRTTKETRHVRTIRSNSSPVVDSLTITVPDSFRGYLDANGVGCNIIIKPSTPKKLQSISMNGVDFSLHMEKVEAIVEVNGVSTNVLLSDFSGRIDSNGVSTKAIIHNIVGDTSIDISGMSSSLTIHEGNIKNHYKISLSGLSSKLNYYGDSRSSFGNVNFNTHHHEDNPLVRIDGSGVSTKVTIDN